MTHASMKYSFLSVILTSLYAFKGSKLMEYCIKDLRTLNLEPRTSGPRSYFLNIICIRFFLE